MWLIVERMEGQGVCVLGLMILYSPGVMNQAYRLRLSLPEPHTCQSRGTRCKRTQWNTIFLTSQSTTVCSYPDGLTKEKKRAVRKRAAKLETEKGEVFLLRKGKRIKVVQTEKEQKQILQACHSDPTSGHYGITKTWNRVAERFYWRGMINDVRQMVSLALFNLTCLYLCLYHPCIIYIFPRLRYVLSVRRWIGR